MPWDNDNYFFRDAPVTRKSNRITSFFLKILNYRRKGKAQLQQPNKTQETFMYYTLTALTTKALNSGTTQTASQGYLKVTINPYGELSFSGPVSKAQLDNGSWYQAQPKVKKTMQGWADEAIRTNKTIRIQRDGVTKGIFTLRPFKVRGENKINVEITREDENQRFYSSMVFSGDFVAI